MTSVARTFMAALAIVTIAAASTVALHSRQSVYQMPLGIVVAVVVAAALSAGAAVVALRHPRPDLAMLSALAAFLLVFALLALMSIGIFVLPLAVLAIIGTVRRASRAGVGTRNALVAGPVAAVGLATAGLFALQPPVVRCGTDGSVSTSTPIWWTDSSGSGSSTSSGGTAGSGAASGEIRVGSHVVRFRCSNGRLTHFVTIP